MTQRLVFYLILITLIVLNVKAEERENKKDSSSLTDSKSVESKKDPTFLDDINTVNVECGRLKCFFRSKSDPNLGYTLIRNDQPKWMDIHPNYGRNYEFAECLTKKYQVYHTYLDPPQLLQITQEDVEERKYPVSIFVAGPVLVTPVRFNERNVLFRCNMNWHYIFTLFEEMEEMIPESRRYLWRRYLRNLIRSLKKMKRVMNKTACLANDFQALIDYNGDIWLFDLDPCTKVTCETIDFHNQNRTGHINKNLQKCTDFIDLMINTARRTFDEKKKAWDKHLETIMSAKDKNLLQEA